MRLINRALERRPFSTRTAELVCTTIKGVGMSIRKVPGTKLANVATGETIYTPPVGGDTLRRHLAAWERFMHEEREIDPLVRMAAGSHRSHPRAVRRDGPPGAGRAAEDLLALPAVAGKLGVLEPRKVGREMLYVHPALLDVLR